MVLGIRFTMDLLCLSIRMSSEYHLWTEKAKLCTYSKRKLHNLTYYITVALCQHMQKKVRSYYSDCREIAQDNIDHFKLCHRVKKNEFVIINQRNY